MSGRTTGLVRVTVTSGTRRVDLALPGAVPVAELVPELARSVGVLDPTSVHAGYRLVTAQGRELARDAGLAAQGVEDGGLLTVATGDAVEPPRVHDDVVEAMVDVVEHDLVPWQPGGGRPAALGAAGLSMALGAVALLLQRGSLVVGASALAAAAALTGVAIVLSRGSWETRTAVAVAWTGTAYAAVAGLVLVAADGPWLGLPVAAAGGAAALTGLVGLVGVGSGRALLLPPVVVGATLLASGLLVRTAGLDGAAVLSSALVLVVMAGSALPWLALGVTGGAGERLAERDDAAEARPVDRARVAADARVAHEILLAVSVGVGVLLVLVAPLAVSTGIWGTALAVLCAVVLLLRTRQCRVRSEVLAGLVSGVAGLAATAAAVLWLHPTWRAGAAAVLVGVGAVLVALAVAAPGPSVRRRRLADLAEGAALVALLPVLVVAAGLFSAIRS
ncbi:MAG TPA: type VII secretion integral membrane protein EccD [Nocardioides sp.]|nr:type VII secretion integral membrane protein EccD [Nocardioides sp.]